MKIIKCDFCGAEVIVSHYDSDKIVNADREGWCEIKGRKPDNGVGTCPGATCTKHICPRCIP